MRAECIQAVESAIGRPLGVVEARGIEQRIRESMLMIAREDPGKWQALTEQEKLTAAASRASDELIAEAQKKKQRLSLAVISHDRIEGYVKSQSSTIGESPLDSLSRVVAAKADGKNNTMSAESLSKGIMAQSMGRLSDAWEAIKPGMLGFMANKEMESAFIRALHGEKSAHPEVNAGAKAWFDLTESLRVRYNAAGGNVGKLDNWGMPHAWSDHLAVKAGKEKFISDMLPLVDRSKYAHEDGRLYTDDEMSAFIGEAWVTIVTNGANKPVTKGSGVKANRHSQHRQLHFKDAASTEEALTLYSGRNVFEAMVGHVRQLSRDIALIETFGPNADHAIAHFIDKYTTELAKADPTNAAKNEKKARTLELLYDNVAGNSAPPPNRRLANAFSMLRAWITGSRLGSAAITSISDEGTLYLTGKVNNLPLVKLFANEVRALNPADAMEKRLAQRAGLLVHTMSDELDRWGTETLGSDIPHKIASAVMKASGLNAITEARRRAFSVTMMDTIGALTREFDSIDKLDANDWRILKNKGITQEEWAVWTKAELEPWRGNDTMLTPESIYKVSGVDPILKERAASKLLAVVLEEQDIAVIEPGARERVLTQAGTVRGTWKGELTRSFFQFKTFPIAMMNRHWRRAFGLYDTTSSKVGYLGTLLAAQTLLGAVAMELNDILSGKDPRTLDPTKEHGPKNWMAAVLKGGSLGLYGDFLFAESTQYGQTFVGAVGGPMVGLVENVDDLTRGNILQAMRGEDTDAGAEFVKFMRANTPGSSLWYTKAATDRIVFHQLQEYFSPGYLGRMQDRARQDMGTEYWWTPGEVSPTRAPDVLEP